MLFASLTYPDIPKDYPPGLEGFELRLDYLPEINLEKIEWFLSASPRPVMLTLRKASQGGKFQGTEAERERLIEKLLALNPTYFDLEGDMRPAFLEETLKKHPHTRFVLSHHDFEKTPENLEGIYHNLIRYNPFTCKIAVMANSTNDALRVLLFAKKHPKTSAICMGERGEFARIAAKTAGSLIAYASLPGRTATAPGQVTAQDLIDIYRYPSLDVNTALYGLIGNPIAKSPGHIHHNDVFHKRNVNALYIKMIVDPEELSTFIPLAKELGIRGLSVTIPLKEKIIPFIDHLDEKTLKIGASNTLRFDNGLIYGTNTDGQGALDALEKHGKVKGKKIVLLGAGGAARGIAFEAAARHAHLVILNRTIERSRELSKEVGGQTGSLNEVPSDADILINCSPEPMPVLPDHIPPKALVMDIVIAPKETPFLTEALLRGCRVVFGEEMFYNQAAGQTSYWIK